jgi:hypothetical protein
MRAAIAEELRALYRVEQDAALPERLTNLLLKLDSRRNKEAVPGDSRSKPEGGANGGHQGH